MTEKHPLKLRAAEVCVRGKAQSEAGRPVVEQLEPRLLLSATVDPLINPFENLGSPTVCVDAAPAAALQANEGAPVGGEIEAAAPVPLAETFLLHSNPGATKVIYLDFDGHTTSGTWWNQSFNGNQDFTTPAYSFEGDSSFSDAELERIQFIWERVTEDYLPFEVDVTTEDPGEEALRRRNPRDSDWGVRVVIGGSSYDWFDVGAGGVAYLNTFTNRKDIPAFVFPEQLGNGNEKYVAEAITHEAGHTLGLEHDGDSSEAYYEGHGSGPTGWAPIMGVGYYQELVQWSKGEYPDANQTEDDLAIITSGNGFGYRGDDHGDAIASADALDVISAVALAGEGIIEQNTDLDYFTFTTVDTGAIALTVDPFHRSANLDILATLYDDLGGVIATSNPAEELHADFGLIRLTAGTYYLSVEGTGKDPLGAGYSDYGSLGYYAIALTLMPTGDANGDGYVSLVDYTVWAANYDPNGDGTATIGTGDFSGDGLVTLVDYTLWASNYTGLPTPTPESSPAPGGDETLSEDALIAPQLDESNSRGRTLARNARRRRDDRGLARLAALQVDLIDSLRLAQPLTANSVRAS